MYPLMPQTGGCAAVILSLFLLLGTGCDRGEQEESGARAPGAQELTRTDDETEPATVEQFTDEAQDPDVDHSIHDASSDAHATSRYGLIELASATIEAKSGSDVVGTVTFTPTDDKRAMQVDVNISGLEPGKHGFHIHEIGDCSAQDASSAGGHFNPYDAPHGGPRADKHHVGDLGNIEADEKGRASAEFRSSELAFSGPASILQKAVVVHAQADDLKTDPAGDAGERVGCGVIRQKNEVLARPGDPAPQE